MRVILNNHVAQFKYTIVKGSNDTSNWAPDKAKSDAEEILYNDMHFEFSTSEQLKQRYAEPELTQRLQQIETKFGDNSQVYPLSQINADLQALENLAMTKYNLGSPSGFLNDLITYLNARTGGHMPTIAPTTTQGGNPTSTINIAPTSTPSATINVSQPDNWGYAIFCGFYPIIVFSIYSFLRQKLADDDWKFLGNDQLVNGLLIGVGYAVLAVNFPFNSPHVILEVLVAFVIALCGSIIAISIKKRLLALHPSRADTAKSSNEKPNKKKEQSPPAEQKIS